MSQRSQANTSNWEPPWSGWIETTGDALLILEAARRGLIPRVTRRLVDSERKMITSGSVFVFDEDESGIKRWTDGFIWSPSRILGNFLLYRETDKRGGRSGTSRALQAEEAQAILMNEQQHGYEHNKDGQTLSRPKGDVPPPNTTLDRHRERLLVGSLTNNYKFKPDGMIKKTFSLTIGGVAQHLISYYKIEDVEQGRLRSPSSLPELSSLDISPEYLDKTHFRSPPKVEIGADGIPRYLGEADDPDTPSSRAPRPLTSSHPLLMNDSHGSGSRASRRYDPYGTSSTSKRGSRKGKNNHASTPPPPQQPYPHDPNNYYNMPPNPAYPMPNYPMMPGYPLYPGPAYGPPPPPPHDGAAGQPGHFSGPPYYPPPGPGVAYPGMPGPGGGYPGMPGPVGSYPGMMYPPYGYAPPPGIAGTAGPTSGKADEEETETPGDDSGVVANATAAGTAPFPDDDGPVTEVEGAADEEDEDKEDKDES